MKKVCMLAVLLMGLPTAAAPAFSKEESDLLLEIRGRTIQLVRRQIDESEKLRACFASEKSCGGSVQKRISVYRYSIQRSLEDYRLLVALGEGPYLTADSSSPRQPFSNFRLNLGLPPITVDNLKKGQPDSEVSVLMQIGREDAQAVRKESEAFFVDSAKSVYFDPVSYRVREHQKQARKFYRAQAVLAAQTVPFVVYMKSERPTDLEIATAIQVYQQKLKQVVEDLTSEDRTPLEVFLLFEPVVRSVTEKNPAHQALVRKMLLSQKHQVGFKAWVDRNSPSVKLAALTTCSLVSSVLQLWPLSLTCGSAIVALTGQQLYIDYVRLQENRGLWLAGAQNYQAFKTSEGRLIYSSLAFLFAGQGVYSVASKIEVGLITTLSNLPQNAMARLSSLTALREGGVRFASVQGQFKSRDLGASIFAEDIANDVNPDQLQKRYNRIFRYADLLRLRESILQFEADKLR